MAPALLYADTSIWNQLCNQAIDPGKMISDLALREARLALGMNVFYEMVKTFGRATPEAKRRGSDLFSYLALWIGSDIPVVRQTPEILFEEAMQATGQLQVVRVLLESAERRRLSEEIAALAKGDLKAPAEQFIQVRTATAEEARTEMRNHIRRSPALESMMRAVPETALPEWLATEALSERGIALLAGHLAHVFPNATLPEVFGIAAKLSASAHYRLSHALVRSGIYLNWRLATRGSLRDDVPDDAYHVVNSSYCDCFLTTDNDQAEQMSHSVPTLRVFLYDPSRPLRGWLTECLQSIASSA